MMDVNNAAVLLVGNLLTSRVDRRLAEIRGVEFQKKAGAKLEQGLITTVTNPSTGIPL